MRVRVLTSNVGRGVYSWGHSQVYCCNDVLSAFIELSLPNRHALRLKHVHVTLALYRLTCSVDYKADITVTCCSYRLVSCVFRAILSSIVILWSYSPYSADVPLNSTL